MFNECLDISVFHLVMKHCVSCLIYYKKNKFAHNAVKRSVRILDIAFCIDFLFYIGVWVSNNSKKGKLHGLTLNINVSIILRLTLTVKSQLVLRNTASSLFR